MRTATALAALLSLSALSLTSCSTSGGGDDGQPALPLRSVTGTVSLPAGTPIDPAALEVVSFADRGSVDADGEFSVMVPDTDLPQVLFVMGAGPAPVLAGRVEPGDVNPVVIDASSTALALTMMNPFLTMFSAADLAALAETVQQNNSWNTLVGGIGATVSGSATGRISDSAEPWIVQLAARIALDALQGNPGGDLPCSWPWLEDVPESDDIDCVNAGAVFYGFRFASDGGTDTTTVLVRADRDNIRVLPSWPPALDPTAMTRTTVDLGDGTFETAFVRAEFRRFGTDTAEGLATVENCGRAVVEMLAPLSGVLLEGRAAELGVETWPTSDLAAAAIARDTYGFMLALTALVENEAAGVSHWYWEEENTACEDFLAAGCPLVRGAVFATQVLADGEYRIPFFADLVTAGPVGSQQITQLDGAMALTGSHTAPSASFVFSPPFAAPGAAFSFDAGACADVDDPPNMLEVRWDWESDGIWDTPWTRTKTAQHSFPDRGVQKVSLQVRDRLGLNDAVVHRVNVGGSESSAAHVVLLRDAVPWAPEVPPVLDQMLEAIGYTEGAGPGRYEVRGSSDMRTLTLTPGEDLLIVQNDQPQTFYNAYGRNQVRFLQFVASGGTLFWEACDLGWNGGSIQAARIVLPGGVELRPYQTWYNEIALPGAPIVEGLPAEIYGQYASHEGIENLPDGATVYIRDDAGSPTLAEFGYGGGWVVLSTQPLEWNFYHNWTGGLVMPNVVCYVLGEPLVHDFGDIIKPEQRGRPAAVGGAYGPTSGKR
jgi:hypothetical protein